MEQCLDSSQTFTFSDKSSPSSSSAAPMRKFLSSHLSSFRNANKPRSKELRAFLIPSVALTARTPGGTNLTTSLGFNEATFVNGIFSELTDNNGPLEVEAPPFELPGKRIEITPVG